MARERLRLKESNYQKVILTICSLVKLIIYSNINAPILNLNKPHLVKITFS